MGYYDKDFFIERTKVYKEKSDSWHDKALSIAGIIFKNRKEKPLRSIKTFFPKKIKEDILIEQKRCFIKCNKTI